MMQNSILELAFSDGTTQGWINAEVNNLETWIITISDHRNSLPSCLRLAPLYPWRAQWKWGDTIENFSMKHGLGDHLETDIKRSMKTYWAQKIIPLHSLLNLYMMPKMTMTRRALEPCFTRKIRRKDSSSVNLEVNEQNTGRGADDFRAMPLLWSVLWRWTWFLFTILYEKILLCY